MKKVFKYDIKVTDYQNIEMPKGAQILCCKVMKDGYKLWALVDPNAHTEVRQFRMAGTGHRISDEEAERLSYIGTFFVCDGALVLHLFEIK